MPRGRRVEFTNARHHVYVRGSRHGDVFTDEASRLYFLRLLSRLPEEFGVEVHAYVLMGNHYHLQLVSREGRLSDAMHFLNSTYASWLNFREGWSGALFSTRFNNRVIESEAYWMHLFAYLHLNPLRAGFVREIGRWRWSSLPAYLGAQPRPEWLNTTELDDLYGGATQHLTYLSGYSSGAIAAPTDFDRRALWAPGTTGRARAPSLVSRPLPVVESEIQEVLDVDLDEPFYGAPRSVAMACWWLHWSTAETWRALEQRLSLSVPAIKRRAHAAQHALKQNKEPFTSWRQDLFEAARRNLQRIASERAR